jgi:hypothetical protein
MYITFLSSVGVFLSFQESRVVNRENIHNLVTSPLTQIEFKSFPGIMERYFLVFADAAFYMTGSILPCFVFFVMYCPKTQPAATVIRFLVGGKSKQFTPSQTQNLSFQWRIL